MFGVASVNAPFLPARLLAHGAIRAYQLTLSGFVGRQCRYLPTCSDYMDEAITRHGLWCGGWMGTARLCRCHPLGAAGFDPVPPKPPATARWYTPWRYGAWRMRPPATQERASNSAVSP
jgi:putative membrane protein insertion efficiency factor